MQVLDDLIDFKKNRGANYASETAYWLIVDWDGRELSEMNRIADRATENGCHMADSNPCFEIWLFQHFSSVQKFKGFAGDAASKGCSRVITELKKQFDEHYDKSKYNVLRYLRKVDSAIRNSTADDQSGDEFRTEYAGSRVYRLVESIIDSSPNNPRH